MQYNGRRHIQRTVWRLYRKDQFKRHDHHLRIDLLERTADLHCRDEYKLRLDLQLRLLRKRHIQTHGGQRWRCADHRLRDLPWTRLHPKAQFNQRYKMVRHILLPDRLPVLQLHQQIELE